MPISRLSLATVISAGALLACSGGGVTPANFLQPHVDLHKVGIRSIGLGGGTLDVQLAIANPNQIKLTGTRLDAGLDLQGAHFGDLAVADAFALTKADTTFLTVPLSFSWSGMASAAKAILNYGDVSYKLDGNMTVEAPGLGAIGVPFSRTGSVSVVHAITSP
jgi:hypothetical protein